MKLLALVVIFEVGPEASESILSLMAQRDSPSTHVLVWDNSPEPCSTASREWLERNFAFCDYHHCPQNWPLSRVYDEVIHTWIKQRPENFSHLLLLDQDSTLESLFLSIAAKAVKDFPTIGLFLPLVKANGHTVSPGHLFYFKGFFWQRPKLGSIRFRFTTAINSGMIIASRYLLDKFPGYPGTLSFYGTDNWFCEQYAKDETYAYVLDSTIHHDLARFKEESVAVKLWRHREEIRALRVTNAKGFLRSSACYLYTLLTCARMALRFRDRRFFLC